jgi:hypothetical protein
LVDISFLDTLYPRAPSLAYGDSPCEYIPVRSTAASMRPTVRQAYVDQPLYSLVNRGSLVVKHNQLWPANGQIRR